MDQAIRTMTHRGTDATPFSWVELQVFVKPVELSANMNSISFGTEIANAPAIDERVDSDTSSILARHKHRFADAWRELADR